MTANIDGAEPTLLLNHLFLQSIKQNWYAFAKPSYRPRLRQQGQAKTLVPFKMINAR
ncbi:hypothetical protein [Polymorphobacter megasporae]|uniref:hypothetical protein n=1 Tax=Glacieibacterium megasporae TaxID=2835787 RepID=UPI001C1E311D|nr:hypothetical protein [Polymorphobacter megasporae]UAJ12710.1 hypothetical protein KTC28_19380 [Polymorphobacter megasporae]